MCYARERKRETMKRTSFDIADEYLPAAPKGSAVPTSDSTPGITASDVLRVFGSGRILDPDEVEDYAEEKPKAVCIRCRGGIRPRATIRPQPLRGDLRCQACGRRASNH